MTEKSIDPAARNLGLDDSPVKAYGGPDRQAIPGKTLTKRVLTPTAKLCDLPRQLGRSQLVCTGDPSSCHQNTRLTGSRPSHS